MTDPYFAEIPEALRRPEPPYPWEEPPPTVRWMWGADTGKPLTAIGSKELLRKRRWLVEKQGMGTYFTRLIQAIDDILMERGGE